MADTLRFDARLEAHGPAAAIVLADEQVARLGDGKKTFPVRVTINGSTLSLRLARMGGQNLIGFSKAARADAGVEIDETYPVEIVVDAGERTVNVPDDLAEALTDEGAAELFGALAYSHRKEFVRWVTEAKKPETRANRIAKAVEMVRAGRTR